MEMIPLDDQTADLPLEAAPPAPETTSAGRESLVVESLENRVLLAAEAVAAPIADAPQTEPAPFVAAQRTQHVEVDLQDFAEAPDPSGAGHGGAQGVVVGAQSPHGEPRPPEAEKVEYRNEHAVETLPENKEGNEPEANRNEFGLATIEPSKSKAEATASRIARELLAEPSNRDTEGEDAEAELISSRTTQSGVAQAAAISDLAGDVAAQLDVELATTVSLESNVRPGSNDNPAGTPTSAEAESAVIAQIALKTDAILPRAGNEISEASASGDADLTDPSFTAAEEVAAAPRQPTAESPNADNDTQPPAEMPSEAHDALFAGGQGVEAVFEQPKIQR